MEFEDAETKMKVLKVTRKLQGSKFNKVFINKDMTESELLQDKDLRRQRSTLSYRKERVQ